MDNNSGTYGNITFFDRNVTKNNDNAFLFTAPLLTEIVSWIHLMINIPLAIILGIFGMVANLVNAIIFQRQGVFKESSTISLFILAIVDLGFSITILCKAALTILFENFTAYDKKQQVKEALTFVYAFQLEFVALSAIVTVFISTERMISVRFPFKIKTWFNEKKSFIALTCLCTFAFIFCAPLSITAIMANMPQLDVDFMTIIYVHVWSQAILSIVYYPVCFTIVIVFNTVVIQRVRASFDFRKSVKSGVNTEGQKPNSKLASKETRLVKMMLVLCMCFLVCVGPQMFIYLMTTMAVLVNSYVFVGNQLVPMFLALSDVFIMLNSTYNIFIYFKMSTRYKTEFYKLCNNRKSKHGEREETTMFTTTT